MKQIVKISKQITSGLVTVILLGSLHGFVNTAEAQKFAYVDTKYILSNISEYGSAQKQLDKISVTWQKEIENKYAEIDKLYAVLERRVTKVPFTG